LYLVVKNAENSVYWQHYAATNRANMIPPFMVSKSGVQTDYPLGQTKRLAPKSLDKND